MKTYTYHKNITLAFKKSFEGILFGRAYFGFGFTLFTQIETL
jgi:hypothetical protein